MRSFSSCNCGNDLLQIGLRRRGLAEPLLRHAEQRLNLPKVGPQLDGGAKLGSGLRIVALEEERHAEIAARIDVVRVQRQDGGELACRQIGLVLAEEFLRLAGVRFDLLLFGRGLGEGGKDDASQTQMPAETTAWILMPIG